MVVKPSDEASAWRRRKPLTRAFMAERVGFEPTVTCATHDFQSCRFGRSRTPPGVMMQGDRVLFERLVVGAPCGGWVLRNCAPVNRVRA